MEDALVSYGGSVMAAKTERAIGAKVAAYRKAAGLTQEELAARLNLAYETISRLESGRNLPSLKRLEKVADALGVRLTDLIQVENPAPARSLSEKDRLIESFAKELRAESTEDIIFIRDIVRRIIRKVHRR